MIDRREEWYDAERKVAVTFADVTSAAQTLAHGHLCGPTSAFYLAKALAAVALLGAETAEEDETVAIQMKCKGPLGGFNVECTAAGTLRGYTEKKTLDEFDGAGKPDDRKVIGERRIQVTRSVPGRMISQGVAASLDGYFAGSLQRRACIGVEAAVSDEAEVLEARGILVEDMPDAEGEPVCCRVAGLKNLAVSPRNLLNRLSLGKAELRRTTPLRFACRCSPERAAAMLAALPDDERRSLPPAVDVTCHMCGRTFGVKV
ncbi:MAG: Hsp33 family molecular chaperone HslO [Kiritimatiellae bacterium]|nr:Hsp33 family molecular chaperone HslO [Kiritimatiellia bacterium]